MPNTIVYYYLSKRGENPVKKFINSLQPRQQIKVSRIIQSISEYGLIIALPHTKKLIKTPLWEIRILGQDNIRILYATIISNSILLVHCFNKKSQKTPSKELKIAIDRLKDWQLRQKT